MSFAVQTQAILGLASSRKAADRERLLSAVVDLCEAADPAPLAASSEIQAHLETIFMALVADAEREIRRRLALRLADAPWAPLALVNVLALDEIEIARPIIAQSPVLQDGDLLRLLVEATLEHQIEVARRPHLPGPVVDEILRRAEPAVLAALAANHQTDLSRDELGRMVEASCTIAALHAPLAGHPQLTEDLAQRLYLWVGQALRQALLGRFRLDPAALDAALADAVSAAHAGAPDEGAETLPRPEEREAMDRQLVEKLAAAGQLRPGYLLRALREQRLSLFAAGLAALGPFDPEQVRKALDSNRPELLALACAGVGIDRSVFPTVLDLVRELNAGRPGGGAEGMRRAASAFGPFAPDIAAAAFRQAVAAV